MILDSKMDVELIGRLRLSYDELNDDETRVCFLYLAAYPEDHEISVEELIRVWVGEELFGGKLT